MNLRGEVTDLVPYYQEMYTFSAGIKYVLRASITDVCPTTYTIEVCNEDEEGYLHPRAVIKCKTASHPFNGMEVVYVVTSKQFELAPNIEIDLWDLFRPTRS